MSVRGGVDVGLGACIMNFWRSAAAMTSMIGRMSREKMSARSRRIINMRTRSSARRRSHAPEVGDRDDHSGIGDARSSAAATSTAPSSALSSVSSIPERRNRKRGRSLF